MFISILATFSFLLLQLDSVPESPNPLTEGAARIFEVGAEASANVSGMFDNLWSLVLRGGLYQAMAQVGVLAAVSTLGFFMVQLAKQWMTGEDWAIATLIWPFIVTVLLADNGSVLADTTLAMRSIGNQVNTTVLNGTVENVSLQQEYQQSRLGSSIDDIEAASISECAERFQGRNARPRQSCISNAREEANRLRQQYGLIPAEEGGWIRSALQWLLRNFLFAIHTAFQWAVEIVLLIIALLGPLSVGLSLLPSNNKPMFSWIAGFLGVFLIKLTLNLISGIAAYAISQQPGLGSSLILPVILGLLAPILSVLVGLEGGTAFFNALSTASVYMGYRKAFGAAKGGGNAISKGMGKAIRRLRR